MICRFINADAPELSEMTAYNVGDSNLFAYCGNNPVLRGDAEGEFWHIVAGAAVGAVVEAGLTVLDNALSGEPLMTGVVTAALTGAASGALAMTGLGVVGMTLGNAAISAAGNAANQVISNNGFNNFNVSSCIKAGIHGGISGALGGPGIGNRHLTNLGVQTVKRTYNSTIHSGFREGLRTAGKAAQYYWKNTRSFYTGYIKDTGYGAIKSAVSSAGKTAVTYVYAKFKESRMVG